MASAGVARQLAIHSIPRDTSSGFEDEIDKVRQYFRDLPASLYEQEKPLAFQLSAASWYELNVDPSIESLREQYRTKLAYNASTSILTIFPMPGKIHNALSNWLFYLATGHTANFPLAERRKCVVEHGDGTFRFIGKHLGSHKKPDLSIAWKAHNQDAKSIASHTVVEIGVSQTDEGLREVRDFYLIGTPTTQRVILVRVDETPNFIGSKLEDIDFKSWEDSLTNTYTTISCAGPVYHQDILCVGALKIVWEVWERASTPEQMTKVFSKRIIPIPESSEFELPFFEIPSHIAAGVMPLTIKPADIEDFVSGSLWLAIQMQATSRIQEFQDKRMKAEQKQLELATQKDAAQQKRDKQKREQADRRRKRSE